MMRLKVLASDGELIAVNLSCNVSRHLSKCSSKFTTYSFRFRVVLSDNTQDVHSGRVSANRIL